MQCTSCGNQFPDNMVSCPNCGAPANTFNQQNQNFNQQNQNFNQQGQGFDQSFGYQQPMSKKQFYKHANLKKSRSNIKASAIILYLSAGISLIVAMLSGQLFAIVDVLLLVGLGLGIQLAQSRACAVIICAYGVFNLIYMMITTGRPGGYLILVAAICAVIATFAFQKSWKEYQQTGILPPAK